MRIFVLVPALNRVTGGIKKLLQYYFHLSPVFDAYLVNYHSYFHASSAIDNNYVLQYFKNTEHPILTEEQFNKMVMPEDCVLFAPATIYNRIKQLACTRKINLEMGFAARNCDYADSLDILDDINEIICFGQVISDDIYRTCGKRFPVIPIGVDLDKFKENPDIRIKNLVGIYVDERHKTSVSAELNAQMAGSNEIALQLVNNYLSGYFNLKKGIDFTFKIIDHKERYTEEEMVKNYQACDIFVSLNRYEGPFLVVLEAMACGCAVVCVDAKGTDDLVIPWRSALRVQPNDPIYVTQATQRLLKDPVLKEKIRQGGLGVAKQHSLEQEKEKLIRYIKTRQV